MKGLLTLRLKPDWKAVELEPTGAKEMELDDIEVGQKYRCDDKGAQYFATVVSLTASEKCGAYRCALSPLVCLGRRFPLTQPSLLKLGRCPLPASGERAQ